MPQNLVPGGARRGIFQARNGRIVRLHTPFEVTEPAVPGTEPKTRICWRGDLMQADGKTPMEAHTWEADGCFRNERGVAMTYDLAILVADEEPPAQEPEPVPALAAPAPKRTRTTKPAEPANGTPNEAQDLAGSNATA
jgi:hypothetical protein